MNEIVLLLPKSYQQPFMKSSDFYGLINKTLNEINLLCHYEDQLCLRSWKLALDFHGLFFVTVFFGSQDVVLIWSVAESCPGIFHTLN